MKYLQEVHCDRQSGNKVLYVQLAKVLWGLLQNMMLFYQNLWGDLHRKDFIINLYNLCVAYHIIGGYQMTVVWHVDALKISKC